MNPIVFQSFGATEMVTGSKHLLQTADGIRLLFDCGLVQGYRSDKDNLNRHFGFDPSGIHFLLLSHAHIDHCGLIPRLVREGFSGKIVCTSATKDLTLLMLDDSAHIQTDDLRYVNERRRKRGEKLLEPLYDETDVYACRELFEIIPYNLRVDLTPDISVEYTDAGHLLGSAAVHVDIKQGRGKAPLRISFTGDIGRYGKDILKDPEPFRQCDYLICEGTYGDRIHQNFVEAENFLLDIVNETCVRKRGKLIIPAFSVGRTQSIIYALDRLKNKGLLPAIPIFVDSPLSVKSTEIIRKHKECYDEDLLHYLSKDPNPFGFDNLHYISKAEDSKSLNALDEPCVIISAAGMAEAGRVKHHIRNSIDSPNNTILFVGYCTPESLGGRLVSGEKEVKIFGEWYKVNCRVMSYSSYSAHADRNEIMQFLSCQDVSKIKHVFLVHGEKEALHAIKETFLESGFSKVSVPKFAEAFILV